MVEDLERIVRISALPPTESAPHESYLDGDWQHLKSQLGLATTPPAPEPAMPEATSEVYASQVGGAADRESRERDRGVRRVRHQHSFSLRIAAFLVVALGGAAILHLWQDPADPEMSSSDLERVAITEPGERGWLTLSDGSKVQLNVNSKLEYPRFFVGNTREVTLNGEAFFNVKSDPSRPFVVRANGGMVRVRGTSFGVRAYERDGGIKVVVVEGAVDLSATDSEGVSSETVLLEKADLGQVVAGRIERVISNVDPIRHLGWQEGVLIFDDTPFSEVVEELENWYDLSIGIQDTALAHRPLTATFDN